MTAISVTVRPQTRYRETELAAAVCSDALYFLRHRDRHHRIRPALPAEIRVVQALERRLLDPTPGCQAVALVRRVDERHRRRVIVEAYGIDLETMGELEAAALFDAVTRRGCALVRGGCT